MVKQKNAEATPNIQHPTSNAQVQGTQATGGVSSDAAQDAAGGGADGTGAPVETKEDLLEIRRGLEEIREGCIQQREALEKLKGELEELLKELRKVQEKGGALIAKLEGQQPQELQELKAEPALSPEQAVALAEGVLHLVRQTGHPLPASLDREIRGLATH